MSLELSVLRVAAKFKLAASSCSLWFHIFRVGACQRQSATHNAVLRLALRHTHSLQLWFTGQSAFGDFLGEWSCLSVESRLRSLAEPCDPNLGTLKFPRFLFLRWLDSFEMEKCKRVRRYGHCIISAEHSKNHFDQLQCRTVGALKTKTLVAAPADGSMRKRCCWRKFQHTRWFEYHEG